MQLSEILDGWAFCYRRKAQNRAVPSSKVSFFTFFVVWTSDFARCLYSKIVLFIDFALLKLLLTFFTTYLVFILCACRMGHLLGPKQKTVFFCAGSSERSCQKKTPPVTVYSSLCPYDVRRSDVEICVQIHTSYGRTVRTMYLYNCSM